MNSQRGFSILELMIGMGVAAFAFAASAMVLQRISEQNFALQSKIDSNTLNSEVRNLLSNRTLCTRNLRMLDISAGTAIPVDEIAYYDRADTHNGTLLAANTRRGNVIVNSVNLRPISRIDTNYSSVELIVNYSPVGRAAFARDFRIPLVTRTENNIVSECVASPNDDSISADRMCSLSSMSYNPVTRRCVEGYQWHPGTVYASQCRPGFRPDPRATGSEWDVCRCSPPPEGYHDPMDIERPWEDGGTVRQGVPPWFPIYHAQTQTCGCSYGVDFVGEETWTAEIRCVPN